MHPWIELFDGFGKNLNAAKAGIISTPRREDATAQRGLSPACRAAALAKAGQPLALPSLPISHVKEQGHERRNNTILTRFDGTARQIIHYFSRPRDLSAKNGLLVREMTCKLLSLCRLTI
jgi:hypothetical protein